MVIRRSLIAVLALLIGMEAASAGAQRPDHGGGRTSVTEPTGTPATVLECADVDTYIDDLDEVLEEPGAFLEFVLSNQEFEDLSAREAEAIVTDGDEVIAALEAIAVPEPYLPGHEGIVLFMQSMIDFTRFYALDSSRVPDVLAYDDAMEGIYAGEVAIAEACPDAIDDLGGYIFIDPSTIEEYAPDDGATNTR